MSVFYEKGRKYNCRINGGQPSFRVTATINGKRRTFYGDGEKEARRRVEEAKLLAASGVDLDKTSTLFGDAVSYWLFNIKRVDNNIKASTFARYEEIYRLHIAPYPITRKHLIKVDSVSFQAYVTSMYEEHNCTTPVIKNTLKVLNMFFRWAVDEGYLKKNPARNVSIPGAYNKKTREVITFTGDERIVLSRFMEDTAYEYDTIIKLAFATGMRKGELLALMWDDVHEDHISVQRSTATVTIVDKNGNRERRREVWETKTLNSVRNIPILPGTYSMLKAHKIAQAEWFLRNGIPRSGYVFTTKSGQLIDQKNFTRSYTRLLKRAGIEHKKFHAIRHTFATEAIRRGVNVKDLQMLMGHSDIQTTYVYVHADEESKMAAIKKIGDII